MWCFYAFIFLNKIHFSLYIFFRFFSQLFDANENARKINDRREIITLQYMACYTNANSSVVHSRNRSVIIIIFMPVQPSNVSAISCVCTVKDASKGYIQTTHRERERERVPRLAGRTSFCLHIQRDFFKKKKLTHK